jgi:hypothetical protein
MILMNSIAMDLIPYSIRTLFQSKDLPFWKHIWSVFLLVVLVYDMMEIELLGSRAIIQEAKETNYVPDQLPAIEQKEETKLRKN